MTNNNKSNNLIALSERKKEKEFWESKLSENFMFSNFPTNNNSNSSSLQVKQYILNESITTRILKLSNNSDHLLFTILSTTLNILLSKYSGKDDISITCPVLKQKQLNEAINSVLILRSSINKTDSFKKSLINTKQLIIDATNNQNYPIITYLQQNKNFAKDSSSVSILLKNIHDRDSLNSINTNFVFSFLRTHENIELNIEYNQQQYYASYVDQIINHFLSILETGLTQPDSKSLKDFEILNEIEKDELITSFNTNKINYSTEKDWVQLFYEQIELNPDKVAVIEKQKLLDIC